MKYRLVYFLISAVVVGAGIFAYLKWGLPLGVDFQGGALIEYKVARDFSTEEAIKKIYQEELEKIASQSGELSDQVNNWDQCKIFEKEDDYYMVNGRSVRELLGAGITKLKPTDGDINSLQDAFNKQFIDSKGKEVNGLFIFDAKTKELFGYESLIYLSRYTDGSDNKEKTGGEVNSVIKSHNMYVRIFYSDKGGDFMKEAENAYSQAFKFLCHTI